MLILSKAAAPKNMAGQPKILLKITTGYDGLFMLDEYYEWNPNKAEPVDESLDPDYLYRAALARREQLRAGGFDVAVEAKIRGW